MYYNIIHYKFKMESQETQAIQEMLKTLIEIAKNEGDKIRQSQGREPTESEAQEIASMIERQFKTALVISK